MNALDIPELKPCPFCGGKPRMSEASRNGWVVGAFVQCEQCSATTRDFAGARAVVEYSHNCFCGTDKLLAARAWNCRPGEGTAACPECGVAVPHRHVVRVNPFKNSFENKEILVELILQ